MTDEIQPMRHHHRPDKHEGDRFFRVRNILNTLFMVGAIIGIIIYLSASHNIGIVIILVSMVFKAIECVLRFLH